MFDRSENNARMASAEKLEHDTKAPGKRNGALGHIGLKVLRFLLRLRGRADGRLDPSIQWLADQIHHSRSAVAAALQRLKEQGFLDWVRRTQIVEDPERPDQYVEQISNAYFLTLPGRARDIIRKVMRRPTSPEERATNDRRRQKCQSAEEVEASVARIKDPELRDLLHGMRADLESANPPGGLK
ncbi:hypothetical protein SAMN03159340_01447 [Sphingomonas sp. NFR15]|nr:hypothetical protein SAMN03159340_01447 [Sphingomonas sp. NFR15]